MERKIVHQHSKSQSQTPQQQPLFGIPEPHRHDVLSGRGKSVNGHPGNIHFQTLVKSVKHRYVAAPKSDKPQFANAIVHNVRSLNPPGRFLKQEPNSGLWYDIGDKKALTKTRQALREGAPEIIETEMKVHPRPRSELPLDKRLKKLDANMLDVMDALLLMKGGRPFSDSPAPTPAQQNNTKHQTGV